MTAPPAKIKAALAAIKERYIDTVDDDDAAADASSSSTSAADIQQAWEGVFRMELLLRGIIVPSDDKLYEKITSAIGKALLTDLPKPLMAGMNVMAGRIAEVCANLIMSAAASSSSSVVTPIKEASAALERANSIQDERWKVLLKATSSGVDPLVLAQGYYTKAALIQVDTPPMWKKVWDLWSRRFATNNNSSETDDDNDEDDDDNDTPPFPAQVAIQNMIRIATNKGNAKRATELQLRLTQSYLNNNNNSINKIPNDAMELSKLFGDTLTPKLPTDQESLSTLAQKALDVCDYNDLTVSDQILYKVLQVRVQLAVEDATIFKLAKAKHETNQNRSVSSTLQQCVTKCREEYYLMADDDKKNDNALHQASMALRDTLIEIWPQEKNDLPWISCLDTMKSVVERLRDRAEVKIQKKGKSTTSTDGWSDVLDFITPLLVTVRESQCHWATDTPRQERLEGIDAWLNNESKSVERALVSRLAINFPIAYWVTLASPSSSSIPPNTTATMMTFIVDLLTAILRRPVPKSAQQEAVFGGAKKSNLNGDMKVARSAAVCCVCQTNGEMIFHITRDAVSKKRAHNSNYLGILQCMVAWSGFYQRPWPHCSNISDARRLLSVAAQGKVVLGRALSPLEEILFDLARADAELLNGGVLKQAWEHYTQAMKRIQTMTNESSSTTTTTLDGVTISLLHALGNNGLARVCLLTKAGGGSVQRFAQQTIDSLESLEIGDEDQRSLYIWHTPDAFTTSRSYLVSVARSLIADSLVSEGRSEEARSFLEAAVDDAPLDADAALGLGAFLLRIHFYEQPGERTPQTTKATQIQLLRAAKLDPTQATPFALLGVWFEELGDLHRARGCYVKSLKLDSSHPVAGRGLLRLESRENTQESLDVAIHTNSSYNGWAWRATGLNKVFLDGEDELAVVALLKSLRCQDIVNVDNEPFAIFYDKPGTEKPSNERADGLAEVAMCYRRLGRFTAAIRAFHGAIEAADENVSSLVLCSCAQVELELALFDSAVDKFSMVLKREKEAAHAIAAYGQGTALLSIAQRDLQDGKAGSAYDRVQQAIEACLNFSDNFGCTHKLLGDLYSFGASLPPNAFLGGDGDGDIVTAVDKQLEFVAKGENAYNDALDLHKSIGEAPESAEEALVAQSADLCDVANNILLQARVQCSKYEKGVDFRIIDVPEVKEVYDRAAATFQTSIELNPLHAPAWCGLGVAVVAKDPLLAQHAFCRCLQLEQMFPDAYSNLGFLYTSFDAFVASEGSMNALTQIADTPMMWMNRAIVLERDALNHIENQMPDVAEREIMQAADAYRAALQVMKHPDAQLGLSITGRMVPAFNKDDKSKAMAYLAQRKDSTALIKEFIGSSCRMKAAASVIYGAMSIEQAVENSNESVMWSDELVKEGQLQITNGLNEEKDLASFLDTEVFEGCLRGQEASNTNNGESGRFPFPGEISLQRQILHNPDRPDLWLALARELTVALETDCPVHKIESAIAAAERASNMLEDSMVHASRAAGNPTAPVEAEMISDALALVHFLQNLKRERNDEAEEEAQDNKLSSAYDLQRALMMCPNNRLAREALAS